MMKLAVRRARGRRLPGLMLEIQDISEAARRMYESRGLVLSGSDLSLYRGIEPDTRKVALFWCLLF